MWIWMDVNEVKSHNLKKRVPLKLSATLSKEERIGGFIKKWRKRMKKLSKEQLNLRKNEHISILKAKK